MPREKQIKWGWRGLCPLPGVWGVSPRQKQTKGREGNPCNLATRGTLNVGEPQANEGGEKPSSAGSGAPMLEAARVSPQKGGGGGYAPSRGVWEVSPRFFPLNPGKEA